MPAPNGYHANSITVRFKSGYGGGYQSIKKRRFEGWDKARLKALAACPRFIGHLIKIGDDEDQPTAIWLSKKSSNRGMGRSVQQLNIQDGNSGAGPDLLKGLLEAVNRRIAECQSSDSEGLIEWLDMSAPSPRHTGHRSVMCQ